MSVPPESAVLVCQLELGLRLDWDSGDRQTGAVVVGFQATHRIAWVV